MGVQKNNSNNNKITLSDTSYMYHVARAEEIDTTCLECGKRIIVTEEEFMAGIPVHQECFFNRMNHDMDKAIQQHSKDIHGYFDKMEEIIKKHKYTDDDIKRFIIESGKQKMIKKQERIKAEKEAEEQAKLWAEFEEFKKMKAKTEKKTDEEVIS